MIGYRSYPVGGFNSADQENPRNIGFRIVCENFHILLGHRYNNLGFCYIHNFQEIHYNFHNNFRLNGNLHNPSGISV